MITITIISLVVGAILGLRYTFMITVPAIVCAVIITTGFGLVTRLDVWSIAFTTVMSVMALQIAYVAGAAIRLPLSDRLTADVAAVHQALSTTELWDRIETPAQERDDHLAQHIH